MLVYLSANQFYQWFNTLYDGIMVTWSQRRGSSSLTPVSSHNRIIQMRTSLIHNILLNAGMYCYIKFVEQMIEQAY